MLGQPVQMNSGQGVFGQPVQVQGGIGPCASYPNGQQVYTQPGCIPPVTVYYPPGTLFLGISPHICMSNSQARFSVPAYLP
jgi:hypothetical protein